MWSGISSRTCRRRVGPKGQATAPHRSSSCHRSAAVRLCAPRRRSATRSGRRPSPDARLFVDAIPAEGALPTERVPGVLAIRGSSVDHLRGDSSRAFLRRGRWQIAIQARREPAHDHTEQQPDFGRERNISRPADKDSDSHPSRRANDDKPDSPAISRNSTRHSSGNLDLGATAPSPGPTTITASRGATSVT